APLDLARGQKRLVEEDQPLVRPADRRDHASAPERRALSASVDSAPTRKSLSRDVPPRISSTDPTGTPQAAARGSATARFARPSVGAAVTRTRSAPPCQPTSSLFEARG